MIRRHPFHARLQTAGRRRGWITTSLGSVALLATFAHAQPINDLCVNAINIETTSFPILSDPVSIADAAQESEEGGCYPFGHTVWWKITPRENIIATISTCESQALATTVFDTVLSVYESVAGACNSLSEVVCSDDECFARASVVVELSAGVTYYIQAGQAGTGSVFEDEDVIQLYITVPILPEGTWIEQSDAGDLIFNAQETTGTGELPAIAGSLGESDADMYRIDICGPGLFSATTVNGTTIDTQLFLFDSSGMGVAFNDDAPGQEILQSTLTSAFVSTPGTYYLAISTYDTDPQTEESLPIWSDGPLDVERAPDALGAAGAMAQWEYDEFAEQGSYIVYLTGVAASGACGGESCPPCAADFNQDGGVTGSDVEAFFVAFAQGVVCGDVNLDGGVTGDDVGFFFLQFAEGGC